MPSDAANAPTCAVAAEASESLLAFADALLCAGQADKGPAAGDIQQFLTFFLSDEELGLPILRCREILRVSSITRIPEAPAYVRGVVNLRGRIVPAVDARQCMGRESAPPTSRSRLVVVEGAGRLFALLVDRVARIVKVDKSAIQPAPANAPALAGSVGLGEATVHLVDVDRLLHLGTAPGGAKAAESEQA
jgi:purine-binding chemotaxis protein CheW